MPPRPSLRMPPVHPDSYRDFLYPLNVFMLILSREEGAVPYLHYGLFESKGESIAAAQERSTQLLLDRLPPPPARLLEVGIGLGTTLSRLAALGYSATGITPDEAQIALVRQQHPTLDVKAVRFEDFASPERFDALFFQESSQYIDAAALFARASELASRIIVIDEFAMQPEGTLHRYDEFLAAAAGHGFPVTEELDLSRQAAPTIDYFLERIPRYRDVLAGELGLTNTQLDDLVASGRAYADSYARGAFAYRLLQFTR